MSKGDGEWLIFKLDFSINGKEHVEVDVLKLKIDNEVLREFTAQSILSNRKRLGKGNILKKLLELPIPHFDKDEEKNLEIIKEIMLEYQKISSRRTQLEKEILSLERTINQKKFTNFMISMMVKLNLLSHRWSLLLRYLGC